MSSSGWLCHYIRGNYKWPRAGDGEPIRSQIGCQPKTNCLLALTEGFYLHNSNPKPKRSALAAPSAQPSGGTSRQGLGAPARPGAAQSMARAGRGASQGGSPALSSPPGPPASLPGTDRAAPVPAPGAAIAGAPSSSPAQHRGPWPPPPPRGRPPSPHPPRPRTPCRAPPGRGGSGPGTRLAQSLRGRKGRRRARQPS